MSKTYKHLSLEERDLIAVLKAEGRSYGGIARIIGRDKSTISRELKRNAPSKNKGYYLGHKAHGRAVERQKYTHRRERLKNQLARNYVEAKMKLGWSPEQISGRIKLKYPNVRISHEAIYQYVYADKEELIQYLPRRRKKRYPKRYHARKHKKCHIPNRVGIEYRPKSVETRKRIGHWETDSMTSRKSKAAIEVMTERKTRLTRIQKLVRKTAGEVALALTQALGELPKHTRKTITYDNGSENTEHELANEILKTQSYFCNPNHSYEKGTVENTIGLVRRFLPKKTDLATVTEGQIKQIEYLLNTRPRKCLNFHTPLEVFKEHMRCT